MLTGYKEIYLTMAKILVKRIEAGKYYAEPFDENDTEAARKARFKKKKIVFGKMLEEPFKGSLERLYKKLRRLKAVELPPEVEEEATGNVDDETSTCNE
jgi:hypothetical protein